MLAMGWDEGGRGTMQGRTSQLLVQSPPTRDAESAYEFLEVDRAVLVLIEDVEDVVSEFAWIAERKELLVDAAKFGLIELTGRAVFEETLVPERASAEGGCEGTERTIAAAPVCQLNER